MDASVRARLQRQARFTAAIRAFFDARGYVEVDTPCLSPFLIPEPAIPAFETTYHPGRGPSRPLWLAPSPELWMKRLLGQGAGNIYQVAHSFRNGDFGSPVHNPEFRLLEWYSTGHGYRESITETEELFSHLLSSVEVLGDARRLSPPFLEITMADAFTEHARIDLAAAQDEPALRSACRSRGLPVADDCTWEEAFHIAFLTLVEPALPRARPVALRDYPFRIRTTGRQKPGTPWTERWELYAGGVELANCYTEETDAPALRAMMREEETRLAGGRVVPAADHGLVEAFAEGAAVVAEPLLSGTALGVDRLEMLFRGEKTLEGVILFPFSAIVGRQPDTR
jgi:elongation factor P--(R)-beta-lysine ligase